MKLFWGFGLIKVDYIGRSGNNLFQYCFGRIISEETGMKLFAEPIPAFVNTKKNVGEKDYSNFGERVIAYNVQDIKEILGKAPKKIVLHQYFQNTKLFTNYKDKIKNDWLYIDKKISQNVSRQDIVVYIRRGDYIPDGFALPLEYYEKVIKLAKYDKIYVCTDDPNDSVVLEFVKKYNAVIHHGDLWDDFKFILNFNKIILSESTFCWWAAYLSDAQEIYFPLSKWGRWGTHQNQIHLKVDEKRYIYVDCVKEHKISFKKKMKLVKDELYLVVASIKWKIKDLFLVGL